MKKFKVEIELPEALLKENFTGPVAEGERAEELVEDAVMTGLWELLREFKECNSAAFKGKMGREELARVEAVEGAMNVAMRALKVEEIEEA
jgi:hypothetical protein